MIRDAQRGVAAQCTSLELLRAASRKRGRRASRVSAAPGNSPLVQFSKLARKPAASMLRSACSTKRCENSSGVRSPFSKASQASMAGQPVPSGRSGSSEVGLDVAFSCHLDDDATEVEQEQAFEVIVHHQSSLGIGSMGFGRTAYSIVCAKLARVFTAQAATVSNPGEGIDYESANYTGIGTELWSSVSTKRRNREPSIAKGGRSRNTPEPIPSLECAFVGLSRFAAIHSPADG